MSIVNAITIVETRANQNTVNVKTLLRWVSFQKLYHWSVTIVKNPTCPEQKKSEDDPYGTTRLGKPGYGQYNPYGFGILNSDYLKEDYDTVFI